MTSRFTFFLLVAILIVGMEVASSTFSSSHQPLNPLPSCSMEIVESIPEGVSYPSCCSLHRSTFWAWHRLLNLAEQNVSIASFYWSLLREDVFNSSSAYQGEIIFKYLLAKSAELNVTIVNSGVARADNDLDQLLAAGAKVKHLDVAKLLGQGVQHSKLLVVDNNHGYLGSANMDWRSLTQVKELGVLFVDCPAMASDLAKVIGALAVVAAPDAVLPIDWPPEFHTRYNRTNPLALLINGIPAKTYITMSPLPFKPPGRGDDLEAIVHIIDSATSFVYVAVMDYAPAIKQYSSNEADKYWPALNTALLTAAIERGVEVRLLVSRWTHTSPKLAAYMRSLRSLNGVGKGKIRIRFFVVPAETSEQRAIPFARVNHNKYMVTDRTFYVGTSNWSGDYFEFTGGAGVVVEDEEEEEAALGTPRRQMSLRNQLLDVFHRDWDSQFTEEL